MCRLSITIDQSVHTLAPVFELIEAANFYIRSVRVVPVASSRTAELHLSLGGGSREELDALLSSIRNLSAVRASHHTVPRLEISRTPE